MRLTLRLILTFLILNFPLIAKEESDVYQLFSIQTGRDFNYKLIEEIDSLPPPYPQQSSFQIGSLPVKKGEYFLFHFLRTHYGPVSYSKTPVLIHELLVLKTNKKKEILDAFHYTLDWQDSPSIRLYRMTIKGKKIKAGLHLKELKMKNSKKQVLDVNAVIDNVLKHKKRF
ncbi:MAG: hypothetical protein H7A25_19590 [Leptospiraceae bacterium]|nr:hypothetical protein [Leptospiraceae bacterium]MCP5502110.1 hypothetical protein [Leptospiraceae bacterium]